MSFILGNSPVHLLLFRRRFGDKLTKQAASKGSGDIPWRVNLAPIHKKQHHDQMMTELFKELYVLGKLFLPALKQRMK
jgi:hypothetical protein